MPLSERDTEWLYDVLETSQDQRTTRPGVAPPLAYELTGVDGLTEGGLRVFPGFISVHEFFIQNYTGHDDSSEVIDVFPVKFLVGSAGYAYGFVYRVRRGQQPSISDVFIDYYNSLTGEWTLGTKLFDGTGGISKRDNFQTGRQMSVSVFGRLVYVFIEGSNPLLFTLTKESPYSETILTNPGPGKQPKLRAPSKVDPVDGFGSVVSIEDEGERPGEGQIVLTILYPDETALDPYPRLRGSSYSSSGSGDDGGRQEREDINLLKVGDYSFAYVLHDSETGRRSALSEVAWAREEDFAQITLNSLDSQGYQEGDQIQHFAALEICWDSSKFDQLYVYRSVKVQEAGGTYIASILHLDKIVDLNDLLTANVGEGSAAVLDPGVTDLRQSVYWYELEDKPLTLQSQYLDRSLFDEVMPKGGASFWYENTMLVSNIRDPAVSTGEENRENDNQRGLGELRWSSLSDSSPELFSPNSRYIPGNGGDTIIAFSEAGSNVIGFSKSGQFHIRKESLYIRVTEIHEGFGIVNEKALDSVGSEIYFVTTKGLKAVDTNARLDDVRAMNKIVMEDWASSLDAVSCAYDPTISCFFVHNQTEELTVCFWMNSSRVTQVKDTTFREVVRGEWPSDFEYDRDDLLNNNGTNNDSYANDLVERGFFVFNPVKTGIGTIQSNFRHRLMIVDYKREKRQTRDLDGTLLATPAVRTTLMDYPGPSVFTVDGDTTNFSGHTLITLTTEAATNVVSHDILSYYLYVLESSDEDYVGRKATIIAISGTTSTQAFLLLYGLDLHGLPDGSKVGISPVYFEWCGANPGLVTEEGQAFGARTDYFRVKHAKSVACNFTDISGPNSTEDFARFRGLLYRDSTTTPDAISDTRGGDGNLVRSIVQGESTNYASFGNSNSEGRHGISGSSIFPAVRIIAPDVDFRLLSVLITGSVRATYRTQRMTT